MKTITSNAAGRIIDTYIHCWEAKDVGSLEEIFEPDAEYYERYYKHHFIGLSQIMEYWTKKVVQSQSDIAVSLKHLHIAENVIIPEWEVILYDLIEKRKKKIYEVAIMTLSERNKIKIHREFWDTTYLDEDS